METPEEFRPVCEGEFDPSEVIVRGDGYVELRPPDKLWGCLPGCNLDTDTPWSNFAASLAKYPDKVCILLSLSFSPHCRRPQYTHAVSQPTQ